MNIASNRYEHAASLANHSGYRFTHFFVDVECDALRADGVIRPLRPQSLAVLNYLVRHAGVLVSKAELMDAVWKDVVVTGDSLTQCIVEIRRALDDDSRRIIRTVHGRGYILDVPVTASETGTP